MRPLALCAVYELEEHGVCDVEPGELVESRWRKKHFAAMVCVFSLGSGHHDDGVAAKVFVKAARRTAANAHGCLVHGHGIVRVHVTAAELYGGYFVIKSWKWRGQTMVGEGPEVI